MQLSWDGSMGGIDLHGDATHLVAENIEAPPQGFQSGQIIDLGSPVATATMNPPPSGCADSLPSRQRR